MQIDEIRIVNPLEHLFGYELNIINTKQAHEIMLSGSACVYELRNLCIFPRERLPGKMVNFEYPYSDDFMDRIEQHEYIPKEQIDRIRNIVKEIVTEWNEDKCVTPA